MKLAKACLWMAVGLALLAPLVRAQNPDIWDPEKSTAKAKQLVEQAIAALGGAAFRDYGEQECDGRQAQIDRSGGVDGYAGYRSYWHFPDKNRTEYLVNSTKGGPLALLVGILPIRGGVFIQLFSGDEGWTMDKSGVNEVAASTVSDFQTAAKNHFHNVLLRKVNEPDVFLRYTGTTTADLRQVDWVEITYSGDEGSLRLALDHATHLPSRVVVTSKDAVTGDMDEDVTILTNYQPSNGVQLPMQITRMHNDRRTYQLFLDSCKVNPSLPADFFTKEGLERRYKESKGKVTDKK
jgi:hypothetical protein